MKQKAEGLLNSRWMNRKVLEILVEEWSMWLGYQGLLIGAYQSEAPTLPQRMGDRGFTFLMITFQKDGPRS